MYHIGGKVALISGGASGIGLTCAKELLRNGLRGVTLGDINEEFGEKALQEIREEFGPNKAIYVKTDVTNINSYEDAFKKTIETFKNLDILINNAGIFNDAIWEKEIAINVNGVIHGVLLGLENYIPKYKTDSEGVIVNISSVAGVEAFANIPVYCATKFAIVGLSKAWGDEAHYERTKVKVLALCPGATNTPLLRNISGRNLGPEYEAILSKGLNHIFVQKPESVAEAMIKVITNGKSGSLWIAERGQDPYEWILPKRESRSKVK